MAGDDSFDDVLQRLQAGDSLAAEQVFRRFGERLIALARRRLDVMLRRKVDPEDVIQSVFRSFFLRQADGAFDLGDWNSLWSLLVRITTRKCGRTAAFLKAQKRNVRRESSPPESDGSTFQAFEAAAPDPTPEEAAMIAETLKDLMSGLSEKHQEMLVLRLQGHTFEEISRQVGMSERTVQRVLGSVRESLEEQARP